jgi:signal transduction histidine kinase
VRDAGRRWAAPAAEAGHDLAVADGAGGRVWAAPPDVAHILDNLLENAIRYSPEGSRIEVALEVDAGRPGFVVSDTGPGIPASERGHVFERFYRGAEGRSAGPGTGLGLAIVAELAERWNGTVELLDGPGTRVRASFPAAAADSSPPANRS